MDLRPGYKLTDAGVIPNDWSVSSIGQTFRLSNGCAFKPEDWKKSGTPIIRIQNLNDSSAPFNYSQAPVAERNRVEPGDLLFAWSGTIGSSFGARVWMGPSGVLNQHIFKVAVDERQITLSYSLLVFARVEEDITKQAHGFKASFVHVKKSDLVKVHLPLPPLPEQRAIADVLGGIDALLSGLDRLIAKKRDLKQAAMQQLLTGQIRLPGFRGEWGMKRLGDLGVFTKGSGIKKDESQSGDIPCIRYGEIYTHHNDCVRSFNSRISTEVARTSTRLKTGDMLFAGSGETKAEIGKCVAFLHDCEAYAGGDIVILRPTGVDSLFMGYYCNMPPIVAQKARKGQGDAVVHISASALASVSVTLPGIDEQSAIATVLSDMDAELTALEARRDKTRALKQGMMQELLTGRTRLVDAIPAAPAQEQVPTPERKPNIHFLRAVLAAEIVDQLHHEPTFGHVKLEKMVFLAEHLCQVDTGSTYLRKAAGPLDRKALHSIDSQLRSQHWFDARKEGERYTYVPLAKRGGHKAYFDRYYTSISAKLSGIIETFRALDTERCEIVATLYAAWNDLLRDKSAVSDDRIVQEVLNHWHEAKQRIPEDRWRKALGWMREKGFVPQKVALP